MLFIDRGQVYEVLKNFLMLSANLTANQIEYVLVWSVSFDKLAINSIARFREYEEDGEGSYWNAPNIVY